MIDTKVNLGGLEMPTPVATASGTFGYGFEYVGAVDYAKLGAVTAKGIRIDPWPGNGMPRHSEVPGGLVNAIGLQGTGIEHFLKITVPWYRESIQKALLQSNQTIKQSNNSPDRQHLGRIGRGVRRGREADGGQG